MHFSSDFLLVAHRVFYGLGGLTRRQKLYWSDSLHAFAGPLSESEFQLIESQGSARPARKDAERSQILESLSPEEKLSLLALLHLFLENARQVQDENFDELNLAIHALTGTLPLDARVVELRNALSAYRNRPVIQIQASIWPLVLDFVLRCLVVVASGNEVVAYASGLSVPIALATLLLANYISRKDRAFNSSLLEQHGGSARFRIVYTPSATQYTIMGLMVISGTYITYVLLGQGYPFAAVMLPIYYFVYLRFFCPGRLSRNSLQTQLQRNQREHISLNADDNDVALVSLETRLSSTTSRLDAYVLESALFGALSFSGFLQIMSDNQVSFEILDKFSAEVRAATHGLLMLDYTEWSTAMQHLDSRENLFCLLSVESLLCSIFFLGVIATRLRFSSVADRVQLSLNLSKAFNEKEEALLQLPEAKQSVRFAEINQKVNDHLHAGEGVMHEVEPVMRIMQYLRNAGLLTFLLILISSGFFINNGLAFGFGALSLAGWAYFNRTSIQDSLRYLLMKIRSVLVNQKLVTVGCVLLVLVAGTLLHMASIGSMGELLLLTGTLMLSLFIFLLIAMYPHVDKKFGEIKGQANEWSEGFWILVKIPMALATGVAVAGIGVKIFLQMTGANIMIMTGFMTISVLGMIFSGLLARPWWLGLIIGFGLNTSVIGLVFKILHLPGSREMMNIGIFGMIAPLLIGIFARKRLHNLLIVFYFCMAIFSLALSTGIMEEISIAYSHRSWSATSLHQEMQQLSEWKNPEPGPNDKSVDSVYHNKSRREGLMPVVRNGRAYLEKYGTQNGFTQYYEFLLELVAGRDEFENLGNYALQRAAAGDSTWLQPVLGATQLDVDIMEAFDYDTMQLKSLYTKDVVELTSLHAALLRASGKSAEAERFNQELIDKKRNWAVGK